MRSPLFTDTMSLNLSNLTVINYPKPYDYFWMLIQEHEWCNRYSSESEGQCTNPLIHFAPIRGLAVGRITHYPMIRFSTVNPDRNPTCWPQDRRFCYPMSRLQIRKGEPIPTVPSQSITRRKHTSWLTEIDPQTSIEKSDQPTIGWECSSRHLIQLGRLCVIG